MDFITNTLYITTIVLRYTAYSIVQKEIKANDETYLNNREKWDPWDPTLIRYEYNVFLTKNNYNKKISFFLPEAKEYLQSPLYLVH